MGLGRSGHVWGGGGRVKGGQGGCERRIVFVKIQKKMRGVCQVRGVRWGDRVGGGGGGQGGFE